MPVTTSTKVDKYFKNNLAEESRRDKNNKWDKDKEKRIIKFNNQTSKLDKF